MKVTAYKCAETGQLFESKTLYLAHLEDLKKKADEAEKLALEDEQIRAICDAPRLHATTLPHLETLLHAALNALSDYTRLRILRTTGVDLTASLEDRRSNYPLMSQGTSNNQATKAPSGKEFRGNIKTFQVARPPGGKHPLETMFPYLNLTDGGGTKHSNGQWVECWGVTLCLDDFPLLRESVDRLIELQISRNQRQAALEQQQQLLEEQNVELRTFSAECENIVERIRALEERLRATRDKQQAIRESISQDLQIRMPDLHREERQHLEEGIPMCRPIRLS